MAVSPPETVVLAYLVCPLDIGSWAEAEGELGFASWVGRVEDEPDTVEPEAVHIGAYLLVGSKLRQ